MSAPASISGSCLSNRSGALTSSASIRATISWARGAQPGVEGGSEAEVLGQAARASTGTGLAATSSRDLGGELLGDGAVLDQHHLCRPAGLLDHRGDEGLAQVVGPSPP